MELCSGYCRGQFLQFHKRFCRWHLFSKQRVPKICQRCSSFSSKQRNKDLVSGVNDCRHVLIYCGEHYRTCLYQRVRFDQFLKQSFCRCHIFWMCCHNQWKHVMSIFHSLVSALVLSRLDCATVSWSTCLSLTSSGSSQSRMPQQGSFSTWDVVTASPTRSLVIHICRRHVAPTQAQVRLHWTAWRPICHRSTVGGHAFPVAGRKVWNGLPSELLLVFKNRLKTYLFRHCYETDFEWHFLLLFIISPREQWSLQ